MPAVRPVVCLQLTKSCDWEVCVVIFPVWRKKSFWSSADYCRGCQEYIREGGSTEAKQVWAGKQGDGTSLLYTPSLWVEALQLQDWGGLSGEIDPWKQGVSIVEWCCQYVLNALIFWRSGHAALGLRLVVGRDGLVEAQCVGEWSNSFRNLGRKSCWWLCIYTA